MVGLSVALALETIRHLEAERQRRSANAGWFTEHLSMCRDVRPVSVPEGAEPGYLRYAVLADESARRRLGELEPYGVIGSYPALLADLDAARDSAALVATTLSGAQFLVNGLWTLPTHSRVANRDREQIRQKLMS
jgi:dTDP-4-amino-4,6-dideoxygalactose transaminase